MIRARSTRLIGSVRDREISSKRRRCSASVGSAITRRGATIGSPNPIPARLLPHLVQNAESRPNILIYRNLYTSVLSQTDGTGQQSSLARNGLGGFGPGRGVGAGIVLGEISIDGGLQFGDR